MINVIEKKNYQWESAESKKFRIAYKDWTGNKRNYFPDFFINNKIVIEIKPYKLKISPSVQAKQLAAEKFCKDNGYIYKIVEPIRLSDIEIMALHKSSLIKFTDRYEKMFKERYMKYE